jgi:hypothetical protein
VNLVLIRQAQGRWQNGAIGAAASLLVTELLIVTAGIVIVGRHVLTSAALWRLLRAGVAAAAMAAAMHAVSARGLLAEAATGLVTFAGCALLLRVLSTEELQLARSVAAQARNRLRGMRDRGARI